MIHETSMSQAPYGQAFGLAIADVGLWHVETDHWLYRATPHMPPSLSMLRNLPICAYGDITENLIILPHYAAAFAVFFVLLSVNVIRERRQHKVGIGTGRSKSVERSMRVHANFPLPDLDRDALHRPHWFGQCSNAGV